MESGSVILVVQGAGRNRLKTMLERQGFKVLRALNGKQAMAQVKEKTPALAVIDPSSLRINGARLSHMLRRAADSVPILWVLDEGTTVSEDGVADLCLERPFTSRKFINRVRRLLPETADSILSVGDVVFDVSNREVRKGDRQRRLTPKQAKLLEALMRHASEVLSRRYLMKHVWNTDYLGDTRTLDVHIRWVREAIEDDPSSPRFVRTVRGVGYRFDPPASETAASQE
jgi:DNA-binding response OmpR family regulator